MLLGFRRQAFHHDALDVLADQPLDGGDVLLVAAADQVFFNWTVLAAELNVRIAQRSLDRHVRAVADALERDSLIAGRSAVSQIVGRDTAALAEQKKTDFGTLAGQMGDRYTYFQGKSGSRIGVGVLAVIQAACIALFQLLSKVLVLTALLLLRLAVLRLGLSAPTEVLLAVPGTAEPSDSVDGVRRVMANHDVKWA